MDEPDELPESHDDEIIECASCGRLLALCQCKGRCMVCLEWREKCTCKGGPRRKRPGQRKQEWLCFECEEPLEYCQCNNRVYENLIKGLAGVKDPRKRKMLKKVIVALLLKQQGRKVNPNGSGIDYSQPGRTLGGKKPPGGSLPRGRGPRP